MIFQKSSLKFSRIFLLKTWLQIHDIKFRKLWVRLSWEKYWQCFFFDKIKESHDLSLFMRLASERGLGPSSWTGWFKATFAVGLNQICPIRCNLILIRFSTYVQKCTNMFEICKNTQKFADFRPWWVLKKWL